MHSELVILGGGPGGYAAAFLAADLGMDVSIVEQASSLGGTCLLSGCIPSKALLHVARLIGETKELDQWGVLFSEPQIQIDAVRARKEKIINTLSGGLSGLAKKRGVRLINARGVCEDSKRLRLEGGDEAARSGNVITYDHLIIAVGSRPSIPAALQLPSDRVMDSTAALALPDIPDGMLVIGGGYIGLEMGSIYAQLGTKVTVIEMTDGLLPGVDRDLIRPLAKRLGSLFEAIHLETKVTALKDLGDHIEVSFENAAGPGSQTFDRVLVSIGRQPNSHGLGLEHTQVQVDEHGFLIVDQKQRTADEAILAIGDVTGQPMLAHRATRQGKVAVEALSGGPATFDDPPIPAVVFTDPQIAWVGLTEAQAKAADTPVKISQYPWAASGRAQALGRTEGLTKLIIEPETEAVLGVGIVGVGAGDLIAEAVLAIEMGCTVRDLTESIHPHPTMSETLPNAGEVFFGLATEVYRPKRKSKTPDQT